MACTLVVDGKECPYKTTREDLKAALLSHLKGTHHLNPVTARKLRDAMVANPAAKIKLRDGMTASPAAEGGSAAAEGGSAAPVYTVDGPPIWSSAISGVGADSTGESEIQGLLDAQSRQRYAGPRAVAIESTASVGRCLECGGALGEGGGGVFGYGEGGKCSCPFPPVPAPDGGPPKGERWSLRF